MAIYQPTAKQNFLASTLPKTSSPQPTAKQNFLASTLPKTSMPSANMGATNPTSGPLVGPVQTTPKQQFLQSPAVASNISLGSMGNTGSGNGTYSQNVVPMTAPGMSGTSTPDPNASYRAAFDAYLGSLQPSSEETAARSRLSSLSLQAKKDEETALSRGETLGFATGEAQRVGRNNSFAIEGAANALDSFTNSRTAMSEAQKARLDFEKSILPTNAEGFTLGKDQVRYDAAGNVIAGGSSGGTTGDINDPTVAAWAKLISGGQAKIDNVPEQYRNLVTQSLANAPASADPKAKYVRDQASEALTNLTTVIGYLDGTGAGRINTAGTALGRAIGGFIPGSDTTNLNAALDTVKALVGFDALQKMRDSSPTGGALGQITERELAFLQSVQGSLNTLQGTEQLKATVGRIQKSFQVLQIVNSPDGTPFELEGETYIKQGDQLVPQAFSSVGGDTNTASNRPQRNNNPLNIKASSATSTYSGVSGIDPKPATDGGQFLTFSSPEAGFAAAKNLIKSSGYNNLSVGAALKRWSGGGYGAEIVPQFAQKTINQLTPSELDTLIKTMARKEGYYA